MKGLRELSELCDFNLKIISKGEKAEIFDYGGKKKNKPPQIRFVPNSVVFFSFSATAWRMEVLQPGIESMPDL